MFTNIICVIIDTRFQMNLICDPVFWVRTKKQTPLKLK